MIILKNILPFILFFSFDVFADSQQMIITENGVQIYQNGVLINNEDVQEDDNSGSTEDEQYNIEQQKELQELERKIKEQQDIIEQKKTEIKQYLDAQKQEQDNKNIQVTDLERTKNTIKYNIVDLKNKNLLDDIKRNCILTNNSKTETNYTCSDIQKVQVINNSIFSSINIYTSGENIDQRNTTSNETTIGSIDYSYIFYLLLFIVIIFVFI